MNMATGVIVRLLQIATDDRPLGERMPERDCGCALGVSYARSFVKREADPKRRTFVDDTLHIDGPAVFFDDPFHNRKA